MTTKAILGNCFVLLMVASFVAWCVSIPKLWRRESLVPATERTPVPWNLLDLCLAVLCVLGMQTAAMLMVAWSQGISLDVKMEDLSPEQVATRLFAGALASLVAVAAILAYLVAVRRPRLADFGLVASRFFADLKLGGLAFVHLVGPVMLIQSLLAFWWPSQHPIIKLLERSDSPFAAIACIIAAVIVAPIVEEFLFRVLLQGWLERCAVSGSLLSSETKGESFEQDSPQRAWWPVIASSAIFALMHAGHGPDMFALFVFATGLGYLYRQTHRGLPCVVVHFLLNAWSMFALLCLVRKG